MSTATIPGHPHPARRKPTVGPRHIAAASGPSPRRNDEPPMELSVGQTVMLLALSATLAAAPLVSKLLPEQYLWDGQHIAAAMGPSWLPDSAASFQDMAALYAAIGLDHAAPVAGLLGVIVFCIALARAVGWERATTLGPVGAMIALAPLVPALVYLGQYSKELMSALVALLVLILPAGRTTPTRLLGEGIILAAAVAYGAELRSYWLIVSAAYVAWRIVLAHFRSPLVLLGTTALIYAALQPMFRAFLGSGLQGQRDWSNAERAGTGVEVHTLITSVMPEATGALGVLAALLALLGLIFPWTLVTSGSLFHLMAGVAIAALWTAVLSRVIRGDVLMADGPDGTRIRRAAALLLAVVLVQALFEPDHGSALKHLTPLLPLAVAVILSRRPR